MCASDDAIRWLIWDNSLSSNICLLKCFVEWNRLNISEFQGNSDKDVSLNESDVLIGDEQLTPEFNTTDIASLATIFHNLETTLLNVNVSKTSSTGSSDVSRNAPLVVWKWIWYRRFHICKKNVAKAVKLWSLLVFAAIFFRNCDFFYCCEAVSWV